MTVGEAVQIAGTALESSRTERPVTYENIREKLMCTLYRAVRILPYPRGKVWRVKGFSGGDVVL